LRDFLANSSEKQSSIEELSSSDSNIDNIENMPEFSVSELHFLSDFTDKSSTAISIESTEKKRFALHIYVFPKTN